MDEKNSYIVTDTQLEESITQEVYLQVGFKTSLCVLIINTGFEAIGYIAPVDPKDISIIEGKEGARKEALKKVREHFESIAQWRKAVHEMREAEKATTEARENASKERSLGAEINPAAMAAIKETSEKMEGK